MEHPTLVRYNRRTDRTDWVCNQCGEVSWRQFDAIADAIAGAAAHNQLHDGPMPISQADQYALVQAIAAATLSEELFDDPTDPRFTAAHRSAVATGEALVSALVDQGACRGTIGRYLATLSARWSARADQHGEFTTNRHLDEWDRLSELVRTVKREELVK